MGERKTPPLASPPSPDLGSGASSLAGLQWPPAGWPMFSCITRDNGVAWFTASARGEDDYLKYEIHGRADGVYELEIISGSGTRQSPLMGIRFTAREDMFDDNQQKSVLDIHIRGQRLIPEKGAILRVVLAMTFLISRIDRGIAPSVKRVLKMYRLV